MSEYDYERTPDEHDELCARGFHIPVMVIVYPGGDRSTGGVEAWQCSWCEEPLYAVPA